MGGRKSEIKRVTFDEPDNSHQLLIPVSSLQNLLIAHPGLISHPVKVYAKYGVGLSFQICHLTSDIINHSLIEEKVGEY
jgi:hypothetical protein